MEDLFPEKPAADQQKRISTEQKRSSKVEVNQDPAVGATTDTGTQPQIAPVGSGTTTTVSKANIVQGRERSTSRVKMRRMSLGMSQVQGIRPLAERTSLIAMEFKRPVLIYLPTYQMEPTKRFHPYNVEKVINEILDVEFSSHEYNETVTPGFAVNLSSMILRKVKSLRFNRYRILVIITIGQRRAQSFNNAIGFVWDSQRDGYVDVHRERPTCFLQATVFGIYLD